MHVNIQKKNYLYDKHCVLLLVFHLENTYRTFFHYSCQVFFSFVSLPSSWYKVQLESKEEKSRLLNINSSSPPPPTPQYSLCVFSKANSILLSITKEAGVPVHKICYSASVWAALRDDKPCQAKTASHTTCQWFAVVSLPKDTIIALKQTNKTPTTQQQQNKAREVLVTSALCDVSRYLLSCTYMESAEYLLVTPFACF